MEKVVVCHSSSWLSNYDFEEVNEYLEKGWTVKSVTMTAGKEYTHAVFVLERD